jgi:hypothetical protein
MAQFQNGKTARDLLILLNEYRTNVKALLSEYERGEFSTESLVLFLNMVTDESDPYREVMV